MTQSSEAAMRTRTVYDEHAGLGRYALRRTSDWGRAQHVVQETLVRARLPAEVAADSERSPRGWLCTVTRNMIGDEGLRATQGRRDYDLAYILEHGRRADD